MALQFSTAEYRRRIGRLLEIARARGLDGLLLFKPESLYYLTGYDSLGYVFFQCLYVDDGGRLVLFSRPQDVAQARLTSIIPKVHVWREDDQGSAAEKLGALLAAKGCRGKRLGVEFDTVGLSHAKAMGLEVVLGELCTVEDASGLVDRLRAKKSAEELAYIRRAAELADTALEQVVRLAHTGRFDGDLYAAAHEAIFRGGGGYPANECILNSGEDAILLRHHAGRRHLRVGDQITAELAASYRRYHAGILRTILIGRPTDHQRTMHEVCREALLAAEAALRPGATFSEVFTAHARVIDRAGFPEQRLHTCGYGLGATYPPTWVDWPMVHDRNVARVETDMVILFLVFLIDERRGLASGIGRTVVVTEGGCESLSRLPLELIVRD